jgi:hypothetical protein
VVQGTQTTGAIVGFIPATLTSNFGSQTVAISNAPFPQAGFVTSFTVQEFAAYSGAIDIGVCTNNGSGNFTISNYVTVTLASTTTRQMFTAPTNFTAFANSPGQYPCFYAPSGNRLGVGTPGIVGFYYSTATQTTIPTGSIAYSAVTPAGGSLAITMTN